MKDEIKEILDRIETASDIFDCLLKPKECTELLDYINNLQEENNKLKNLEYKFFDCSGDEESFTLDNYLQLGNKLYDLERENEDYKSRNEKAIKYNYELQERYCHSALFDEPVASKIYEIAERQLNILQGVGN